MLFIITILLVLSCAGTVRSNPHASVDLRKVDSIYWSMTPSERVRELILVDRQNQPNLVSTYFEGALTSASAYKPTQIVQLDESLNPFPLELTNLPNLYTLASLTQEDVISTYLYFFENAFQARGINKCILPDIEDSTSRAALFIEKMYAHNEDFFLSSQNLSFENNTKRRFMLHLFEDKEFWVISDKYEDQVIKKLDKYAEKILSSSAVEHQIKNVIASRISPLTLENSQISKQLSVTISKGSVIPLQRQPGIFPMARDTVCFLTNQPFSMTANMLRKYAYVITTYEDIAISKAPIIIDQDANIPSYDLFENRSVIYIGDPNHISDLTAYIDAALLYTYPSEIYSYVIPQQLFGATDITGALPRNFNGLEDFYTMPVTGFNSLGYAPSEMAGLDQIALQKIQSILREAIETGCTPGGQLAVAVDGAIVLDQAFGHLTYDSLIPTDRSTLYDLASVTKVTATLLAMMKLYEDGLIELDAPISKYLPEYSNSNKEKITIRALLSHNAGLRSYVPFWQHVLSADLLETFYYDSEADMRADNRSYGMKPSTNMKDTLNSWILNSELIPYDSIPPYRYSDIGFMILHQIIERISGMPMDKLLQHEIYGPLGLKRLTFNPLDKGFERFEIAPTEHDYFFRDEMVWGEVHDRNALVFGGIAGHAGLFSNAGELLVVMQALLQGGSYGGTRVLKPTTIEYFNQQFYPNNRRALGWDKKDEKIENTSLMASSSSFGHTGFTGTIIWADPQYDVAFVFLSNRIYPNANNFKLIQKNIRTRLQDVVYESLLAKWIK